jgi:hypothetical protein
MPDLHGTFGVLSRIRTVQSGRIALGSGPWRDAQPGELVQRRPLPEKTVVQAAGLAAMRLLKACRTELTVPRESGYGFH